MRILSPVSIADVLDNLLGLDVDGIGGDYWLEISLLGFLIHINIPHALKHGWVHYGIRLFDAMGHIHISLTRKLSIKLYVTLRLYDILANIFRVRTYFTSNISVFILGQEITLRRG